MVSAFLHREKALLEQARQGDQRAFDALVAPYRGEFHAHCYRILASFHDAEDALQETLLRAWRGWQACYEERESLELAFIAALQYLPPLQRAALILRDVLGFSAQEVANQVGTSVPAVTSALQRARAATERRLPQQSQRMTLRALGDERTRQLVHDYVDAIERADADSLVKMLTEQVAWAMPLLPTWYRGREAVFGFLTHVGFNERWRHLPTRANGQLALGYYTLDPSSGRWVASALDLLRLEGEQVAESDYFLTAELLRRWGADNAFVGAQVFPRFGLPATLE
jgi:RNA polymerase sigma-70 factor, ECF subfamily